MAFGFEFFVYSPPANVSDRTLEISFLCMTPSGDPPEKFFIAWLGSYAYPDKLWGGECAVQNILFVGFEDLKLSHLLFFCPPQRMPQVPYLSAFSVFQLTHSFLKPLFVCFVVFRAQLYKQPWALTSNSLDLLRLCLELQLLKILIFFHSFRYLPSLLPCP